MIKKIGVLTSGGDSPGMNAAVAAVIKTAIFNNIEAYVVKDGFKGLVNGWYQKVDLTFAGNIISRGGTVIGSARLPEFKEEAVRKVAIEKMKKEGLEALVVIGGDGSYQGAEKLTQMGINCIGLPGTIDNDIASTDFTIGFDTALNTVVRSVDAIRDTMESHNRCAIVEVMGNKCGDLTLYGGIATGAEIISTNESKLSEEQICSLVTELNKKGKRSVIVLVSELMYDVHALAKQVEQASGYVTRATVLGHVQRGGTPSAMDRYIAFTAGIFAVEQLIAGKGGLYIGLDDNELVARDIESTLGMPRVDRREITKKINDINFYFK